MLEATAHYLRTERAKDETVRPAEDASLWREQRRMGLRPPSRRAKMGLFFKYLIRFFYYPPLLFFVGGALSYIGLVLIWAILAAIINPFKCKPAP